mgnify:CR=1 FL=1
MFRTPVPLGTHKTLSNGRVLIKVPWGWQMCPDAAAAEWATTHSDARRQQAEQEGSLAALVCNPTRRMAQER